MIHTVDGGGLAAKHAFIKVDRTEVESCSSVHLLARFRNPAMGPGPANILDLYFVASAVTSKNKMEKLR